MAISLKIKDMLGVSHADLQFNRGVNLISGGNNSGKTSKSITTVERQKMSSDTQNTSLYTIPQFCKKHPAFSVGGLRWQVFNAKTNGLDDSKAIVRVGRRVLIHETRYLKAIGAVD